MKRREGKSKKRDSKRSGVSLSPLTLKQALSGALRVDPVAVERDQKRERRKEKKRGK